MALESQRTQGDCRGGYKTLLIKVKEYYSPAEEALGLIPFLRCLQPPSHSQTSQRSSSTLTLTHRSQFMGEMGLLLLICLLFLPFCLPSLQLTPIHLHPCIIHFPLPLLCLQPLLLIVHLFLLLHLVLSASDILEMSGCQNNGLFQITTSSPGSPHQQLPLQTKMRTLMIPLISSRLVLLPQLNPHLTDSPRNALMLICGTQLVRKSWRLTDSMALGRSSNYPLAGMQLAPDGS